MADDEQKNGCGWICGVVEGFYGRPWTPEQRKELFRRMQKMGMNTYVYAPKDDLKHRAYWRDMYTVEEADHLQSLIEAAKKHGVVFYYALSPGLDIVYSMPKEINYLKQKLDQVKSLGCEAFALLFDDIEPTMSDADRQKFSSFAQAQVNVTNDLYEHLGAPAHFMFCPTEYCESRAVPTLESSEYLRYIGQKLARNINVLWTGPRVISRLLTEDHLTRISNVLRRKPLIWDNLHANDYDNKRVFIGPYSGRPVAIKRNLAGVVTNPNCEFESNYVAMHTLAYWGKCHSDAELPTAEDAALEAGGVDQVVTKSSIKDLEYHPVRALHMALNDWLPEMLLSKAAPVRGLSIKPQADLVVGINTCASVTSTTSSNSSLTTTNTTAVFTASPSVLPLYTPPVVAETIKNPFIAPPIIDPIPIAEEDPILTPAMQAVNSLTSEYSEPMELVPSGSTSASTSVIIAPTTDNSPSKSNTIASAGISPTGTGDAGEMKIKTELIMKSTTITNDGCANDELMDSKSFDNLTSLADTAIFKEPREEEKVKMVKEQVVAPTEAMIVDTNIGDQILTLDGEKSIITPIIPTQPLDEGKPSTAMLDEIQMLVDGARDEGVVEDEPLDLAEADSMEITRDDIQLLAELFYLPFEHGPRAYWIIDEFVWLKANGGVMRTSKETGSTELAQEWLRRAVEFDEMCKNVTDLCRRIVECPNRGMVYDFYPYVWDLQGIVNVLNAFVKWLALGYYAEPQNGISTEPTHMSLVRTPRPGFKPSVECEPWIFRGGLMGELQKLLSVESVQDLFICRPPHPPCGRIYRARPYCHRTDRGDVYSLCKSSILDDASLDVCAENESGDFSELIGDWIAGPLLQFGQEYCFVVEDEHKDIVGFALAAKDSVDYYEFVHNVYLSEMRSKYSQLSRTTNIVEEDTIGNTDDRAMEVPRPVGPCVWGDGVWTSKDMLSYLDQTSINPAYALPHCVYSRYPSILVIRLQASVLDTAAPKRLLASLLSALKTSGSTGVHGQVRRSERNLRDLYCRLGFFEISMLGEEQTDIEFLGRLL